MCMYIPFVAAVLAAQVGFSGLTGTAENAENIHNVLDSFTCYRSWQFCLLVDTQW